MRYEDKVAQRPKFRAVQYISDCLVLREGEQGQTSKTNEGLVKGVQTALLNSRSRGSISRGGAGSRAWGSRARAITTRRGAR